MKKAIGISKGNIVELIDSEFPDGIEVLVIAPFIKLEKKMEFVHSLQGKYKGEISSTDEFINNKKLEKEKEN